MASLTPPCPLRWLCSVLSFPGRWASMTVKAELFIQRVQDLPWTLAALCQDRLEGFPVFLLAKVSLHSFPKGILGRWTRLSATDTHTYTRTRTHTKHRLKKFKRKEPAVQSRSRESSLCVSCWYNAKENQKTGVRKADWDQARRADKKAKKGKRVLKTAMVAAKTPTKAANKQKIVNPVKVSALRVGRKS